MGIQAGPEGAATHPAANAFIPKRIAGGESHSPWVNLERLIN
jgi:hypothetical protein